MSSETHGDNRAGEKKPECDVNTWARIDGKQVWKMKVQVSSARGALALHHFALHNKHYATYFNVQTVYSMEGKMW